MNGVVSGGWVTSLGGQFHWFCLGGWNGGEVEPVENWGGYDMPPMVTGRTFESNG